MKGIKIAFLCLFFMGCTTVSSLKSNPTKGYSTISKIEFEEAEKVAREVLEKNGIKIKSYQKVSEGKSFIMGSNGLSLASYGEIVKVYLEQDKDKVLFYVESKPKMVTNYMAEDHGPKIINDLNTSLQLK